MTLVAGVLRGLRFVIGAALLAAGCTADKPPPDDAETHLRHHSIERGSATIQVTQRWTASWWAGGESGTLADRLLISSSLVLPIDELEAVITG